MGWTEKHLPSRCEDVVGQENRLGLIRDFILDFKNSKKKAVLIHGPVGCGKTSAVYALANEIGYEIIEMNASDFRKKDQINTILGAASKQMSLFGKGKIILVEEIDGISGRKDFGGIPALAKLIGESAFPIVMTANNPFASKFSPLRKKATLIQFKPLETEHISEVLKKIAKKEKIKHKEEHLKSIARRSGGDCRAAINDLQMLSNKDNELREESIKELVDRDKTESMLSALVKIFKSTDPSVALGAFNNIEEDMDKRFLWIDHNLPYEYTEPEELEAAYNMLSRADVLKGRIRRRQHWRFLAYINDLLTAGIAVSKKEKKKKFVQYKQTTRLLKLWWAKQKNAKKKAIAQKIAEKTHTSKKEMIKSMPYIQNIFQNNKKMASAIAEELELDNEEIAWLKK
jgi:replication factor C large subunit